MLAIRLRKTDPNQFITTCKASLAFYEESLQNPGVNRPDILAIELLFQRLQYFIYAHQGDKKQFLDSISKTLDLLIQNREANALLDSFQNLIRDDWEFQFTFNYLFREKTYNDHLYDELKTQISTYKNKLGKEKNDRSS